MNRSRVIHWSRPMNGSCMENRSGFVNWSWMKNRGPVNWSGCMNRSMANICHGMA